MTTKKTTPKTTTTKQTFKDYHDYLKSDKWKALRREALLRDSYFCIMCAKKAAEEVHHHKYPKDWNNDSIDNLICVCHDCHESIHGLNYSKNRLVLKYDLSTHPTINQWLLINRSIDPDSGLYFKIKITDNNNLKHIDFNVDSMNINELLDIFNCLKKSLDEEV